jgi:ribosomal-protein-alanine N-acetyltransferase
MTFPPFTNLTTERLFLRELQPGDAEEIFRLRSDETINTYIDRPRAITLDDAVEFIQKIIALNENNESVMWAITEISDSKLIGTVLFWNIEPEHDKAEIGYELLPEYHGKGIMTEALEKVVVFGFEEMKLKTITACTNSQNAPSIKVLSRTGFKKTGQTDNGYNIYELYKQL